MADEKRLVWIGEVETELRAYADRKHAFGQTELANGILKAVNHLQTISTAKNAVEVKHGRWERAEYHGFLRCSKCKDVYIDDTWVADGKWNYCPNCGAKMDGDTA